MTDSPRSPRKGRSTKKTALASSSGGFADVYGKKRKKWERAKLPAAVKKEPDEEWRKWFAEIAQRRTDSAKAKEKRLKKAAVPGEDGQKTEFRKAGQPQRVGPMVKKSLPAKIAKLADEYGAITELWNNSVGKEIADECEIYSFKGGVLTMTVYSSTLLQEIRQFHQTALLADLRDIWNLDTPLLSLKFRIGERIQTDTP